MHPEVMIMMARQHTSDLLKEAEMDHLSAAVARAERARGETPGPISGLVRSIARLWLDLPARRASSGSRP